MKFIKKIGAILISISLIYILAVIILKKVIFPLKYETIVNKYAEQNNVDKYLVFSVIKKESNFKSDAISSKEAKGLMQVLDSTAKEITKEEAVELLNEEDNIEIGTKYLKYLIDKYDGDILLALCAYNAGLGNVDNWIKNETIITDGEADIAKIPFQETKQYVKNILTYYYVYMNLYN